MPSLSASAMVKILPGIGNLFSVLIFLPRHFEKPGFRCSSWEERPLSYIACCLCMNFAFLQLRIPLAAILSNYRLPVLFSNCLILFSSCCCLTCLTKKLSWAAVACTFALVILRALFFCIRVVRQFCLGVDQIIFLYFFYSGENGLPAFTKSPSFTYHFGNPGNDAVQLLFALQGGNFSLMFCVKKNNQQGR